MTTKGICIDNKVYICIPGDPAWCTCMPMHPFNNGTMCVDLNPLSYLLPKQRPKYKEITDYISEAQGADEKVLLGEAGCEVVLKSGGKKT